MSSQEYAGMINSGQAPWNVGNWSDSSKEQYFSLVNAEAANEREMNMWRLNNEYNTPQKQLERMIQAGINPAAAYSQISAGNSSSVPNTHEAKAANFHDTTDKIGKVSAIMNGISDIVGSLNGLISGVSGIQDIAIKGQNNWFNQMRANYAKEFLNQVPTIYDSPQGTFTYQIAPGKYIDERIAMFFPELVKGFKTDSYKWLDAHSLVERQTRVDQLVQDIFSGFDNRMSASDLIRKIMELVVYGGLKRFNFGF